MPLDQTIEAAVDRIRRHLAGEESTISIFCPLPPGHRYDGQFASRVMELQIERDYKLCAEAFVMGYGKR